MRSCRETARRDTYHQHSIFQTVIQGKNQFYLSQPLGCLNFDTNQIQYYIVYIKFHFSLNISHLLDIQYLYWVNYLIYQYPTLVYFVHFSLLAQIFETLRIVIYNFTKNVERNLCVN